MRRRAIAAFALVLAAGAIAGRAHAAGVLDRVRSAGMVRCGAEERPGIASMGEDGRISGLAVDLCRAVAIAVLGPGARIGFRIYDSARDFDAVRQGREDVEFLTGAAIADHTLTDRIVPGPTVFIEPIALMVPDASPAHRVEDLSGKTICLMIGSDAQRALEAAADRLGLSFARLTFEEDVEMLDAYNVQRCQAVAGETTSLATMRRASGINRLASRLLTQPLALFPIIAATGTADGKWSALVAWVIDALLLADGPPNGWQASGAGSLPLTAGAFGLQAHWQSEVEASTGSYATMIRRNLTRGLGLEPGPNALWPDGLFLVPSAN